MKTVVKTTTSLLLAVILCVCMVTPAFAAEGDSGFQTSAVNKYSTLKSWIKQCKETNADVVGWLVVPGTDITEPITYNSSGNNYYVNRDWKGVNYPNNNYTNYVTTATYVDARHKFGDTWQSSSRNTILYGHNWTNLRAPFAVGGGTGHKMFGQLPSYTDMTFAQNNPYIYYSTGENEGIWKVFAVAYCELKTSFFYNNPNPTKEAYASLLSEWKQRSMYNFDVDVNENDRILTLSTCTRQYSNMGSNQRFVVVARLLRDGESENDPVSVSVNSNMKQPQF